MRDGEIGWIVKFCSLRLPLRDIKGLGAETSKAFAYTHSRGRGKKQSRLRFELEAVDAEEPNQITS